MSAPTAPTWCKHCERTIVLVDGVWSDLEAEGDDSVWRETCDAVETFTAEHEPMVGSPEPLAYKIQKILQEQG